MNIIYLAGGCFWGMEDLFRSREGVINTEVGYSGGKNDNPTYEFHPGHAETLKIEYDDTSTSYSDLLDFFFRIHDPTTLNRQGNDVGEDYRSAVFYEYDWQVEKIRDKIKKVEQSGLYSGNVTTSIEKFSGFWSAEDYHQDYLQKNPGGYTCHYIRSEELIG